MAVQGGLLEFSSLLRGRTIALFCDFVTTVACLRRLGGTRSQDLFFEVREILLWVESMKITLLPQLIQGSLSTSGSSQSAQPGDGFSMDVTPGGSPGPSSPVASDHSPVRYIAVSKAPCVLCSSVAFLRPWDTLQTYAFPPITLITRVLLKLRVSHTCDLTLIAPFWPQENGLQLCWTFPQTFQWNYPNVEIYCDNRISIGFKTISFFFV